VGKMRHYGINGKNDGTMEGIRMYLDERTVKTVAKIGNYVSMGERLVLRATLTIIEQTLWVHCLSFLQYEGCCGDSFRHVDNGP